METKVLDISLYKEFTFVPHIQQLKRKCVQSLDIHKLQSHQSYGSDKTSLLKIVRSLIFFKIDYGRIVYQSTSVGRCSMSFTDSGQLQVLCARVPLRVFVESDMWCLEHQCKFTALLYAVKVASLLQHPCNTLINDHSAADLFLNAHLFPTFLFYSQIRGL